MILIDQLRNPTEGWSGDASCVSAGVAAEAADLIEQIFDALREMHQANANAAMEGYAEPKTLDRLFASQGPAWDALRRLEPNYRGISSTKSQGHKTAKRLEGPPMPTELSKQQLKALRWLNDNHSHRSG